MKEYVEMVIIPARASVRAQSVHVRVRQLSGDWSRKIIPRAFMSERSVEQVLLCPGVT